jgi:hypothetical protein
VDDVAWMIGDHNLSALERVLQSAERLDQHYRTTQGRPVKARELCQGVKAITSAAMANQILNMIQVR